jgi:hypothetical protein
MTSSGTQDQDWMGQCGVSASSWGTMACGVMEHRVDLFDELFAKLEFDGTVLEVAEEKCWYNRFYDDFKVCCGDIHDELENENEKCAEELKALMTLNCQSGENAQCLTG